MMNDKEIMAHMTELIYLDNHYWSERGCPTCREITEMIGQPFGCNRYAIAQQKRRERLVSNRLSGRWTNTNRTRESK